MVKELERDLGLFSVLAISIGAMIGSGIFILPAIAVEMAGPAVVLAYVVAGLLVVPAALSKSEMATAMPEAGGTYIYIERGMGPLLGTVAGLGTWFALSFKGALALVGGVPYLLLVLDVSPDVATPLALALAALLVGVNLVGAKQTGFFQILIVAVMLAALTWFVVGGVPSVQAANYEGFFDDGVGGLLAATGLVFVSYAGVTKVASVAEEVEDPDRNIPLGILGSLAFTTVLYALIVTVMLGVTDPATIADSTTPMADAAMGTLGTPGVVAVVFAAILALVSTANAGVLSSSRYPFAMSRDKLAPPSLASVSERFGTPSTSILLTGAVLLVLIAFVPLQDIAKLASAFQILVFVFINLAVVAFRRGSVEYEPSFHSPLYPWIQFAGVVGGLVLLTQMGTVPLVGSVVITVAGIGWFYAYGRKRVDREGAAVDAVRREVGRNAVERTRDAVEPVSGYEALVAIPEGDEECEETLLSVAADLVRPHHGRVTVVRFDHVADQVPLDAATDLSDGDLRFEERTDEFAAALDVPVNVGEVVSHDTRRALANYVTEREPDVIVLERDPAGLRSRLFGRDVDWVLDHTTCDAVLVEDRGFDAIDTVSVVTDDGPYDPPKVAVADAIATAHDAEIRLEYPREAFGSSRQREAVETYHDRVAELCSAPVRTGTVLANGGVDELEDGDVDLIVVGRGVDDAKWTGALVDAVDCSALVVRPRRESVPGPFGRALERWLF